MAADFNFGNQTSQSDNSVAVPQWLVTVAVAVLAALVVDRVAPKAPVEVNIT